MVNIRNKWLPIVIALFVLMAFVVGCGTTQEPAVNNNGSETPAITIEDIADKYYAEMPDHMYKIGTEELKERIDAKDDSMLIISIRKAEDYTKGHIQGAVNIPFAEMHNYLDKLPVDKEIFVYCYTGQTAGQTVAILNMYGYNARSVNLGFVKGWEAEGYPVETTVNELPANVTPAEPDPAIAKILKDYFAYMPEDVHKIDCQALADKIAAGETMQVVDIRSAEDFAAGHIAGAINVPFKQVNEHFSNFAKDKPVYVCCVTGQTAGQTVAVLNTLGINAYSVNAGFKLGWVPANCPVEK